MEYLRKGKANVIIDGQWGSTGKGKLVGYIAKRSEIAVATCDFQTNAGHTWVSDAGEKYVVQQVPTSFLNDKCILCINPGATINTSKLLEEIERYNISTRLYIHPHAAIIEPEDTLRENDTVRHIASTMKGCGSALSRKIQRIKGVRLAKDIPELEEFIANTSEIVQRTLLIGGTVLVETAQGFDLSLNHGWEYPYTTSRDVTVASALSNAGIPVQKVGNIWGSLRTYPIRVGNVEGGESGPYYPDQSELTWPLITEWSGSKEKIEEITTVTKRIRRVFTWSDQQFNRFLNYNCPTHIFLNFINYLDMKLQSVRTTQSLSNKALTFVRLLNDYLLRETTAGRVALLGTGSRDSDMIEME